MQYVRLGNTGLEVSRLALGCMDFPTRLDEPDAQRVVDAALDQGVNLFDTADAYGSPPGSGETALGRLIRGRRDRIVLATKCRAPMDKAPNRRGCSRQHILRAIDESLVRLGADWIDLYQLHHPDPDTPVEETLETLDGLVRAGKVRYVGVCNHYAWQMAHMLGVSARHGWEPIASIQCRYNATDRQVENETVPFVQRFGLGMIVYGPLDAGILSGRFRRGEPAPEDTRVGKQQRYRDRLTDDVFDMIEAMEEIGARHDATIAQVAMAWVYSKPVVTTILMGGSRPEHFEPMAAVPDLTLDPADLARLDALGEHHRYKPFWNQAMTQGARPDLSRW